MRAPTARASPRRAAAAPRTISMSRGAPGCAKEPTDVVATVRAGVARSDGVADVRSIGAVPDDVLIGLVPLPPSVLEPPPPVVVGVVGVVVAVVVAVVVGSGHVALALPPS